MTSSLAKQLESRNRNPEFTFGTGTGRREGKLRPSFLFDPKVAATYDLDTMFNIGSNGYAELLQLDPAHFAAFEQPIFSEAAKATDRALRDSAFNKKLDQVLHQLLLALSPHFLLKPAGKVMEWLIRRFRINEFNVESVVACVLPYYETKQFTHMLTTLDLSRAPRWAFLAHVVETAKPMDRHFLMRRLFADQSLVSFTCETILERVKAKVPFNTAFTFYTTTLITYVTKANEITPEMATVLLPFILDGVKSANREWRLSNYLVLCQLAARTSLSDHSLTSLLSSIVHTAATDSGASSQALLTLICLAQSQPHFPGDLDAVAAILDLPDALETLERAAAQYKCAPLLSAMVNSMCVRGEWEKIQTLVAHAGLKVPAGAVEALVENVLAKAVEDESVKTAVTPLLHRLQGRYSASLDTAVATFVHAHANGDAKNKVFTVIEHCLGGTAHAVLPDLGTTMYLALRHTEPVYCLAALRHLATMLDAANKKQQVVAAMGKKGGKKSSNSPSVVFHAAPKMAAEDATGLAEAVVDALAHGQQEPAITETILSSPALIDFIGHYATAIAIPALVQLALASPSQPAVAAIISIVRDHAKELVVASDAHAAAHLYARHAQAAHADWLRATKYTPTPAAPVTGTIAELLAVPAYAASGLHWVTTDNLGDLIEPVVKLINGTESTKEVREQALKAVLASNQFVHHRLALYAALSLADADLAALVSQVNGLVAGPAALEYLCPGLRHATPQVVRRCLEHIAAVVRKASQATDFQAVLPYVVPCLLNADKHVRDAVVVVMRAVIEKLPGGKSGGRTQDPVGGYAAKDVLFVEPKALRAWLSAAVEADVASSSEAVMYLSFRKKGFQVLEALLSHMPFVDLDTLAAWLKIFARVDSPQVFSSLHMYFRQRHAGLGDAAADSDQVNVLVQFIHCITPTVASHILKADCLETITQFLNGYSTPALARVQQATLTRITPELWTSLSADQQFKVLYVLLNIASKSQVSDVVLEAKSVLKRIPLSVNVMVNMFHHLISTKNPSAPLIAGKPPANKRANLGNSSGSGGDGNQPMVRQRLGKLTSLLELVSYKDVDDSHLLVAPLFATLQTIINHPAYNQYDYIIQLVLSDLLHVNKDGLDESVFRVDLLVSCIRSTDNPQTHNSVLLVLSALAPRCADKVLLNVMPIFTFMGAHVLRQDDEYTFNVIESTIEKIIPSLLLNVTHVKHVIQVFVDAIQHIPVHRRLRLFTTLIRTLGVEYLYAIVALLLEQEPVTLLEFCLLMSSEFPVTDQLRAMIQLVKLCNGQDEQPMPAPTAGKTAAAAAASKKGGKPKRGANNSKNNKMDVDTTDDQRLISAASLGKLQQPVLMYIDENLMLRSFIESLSKARVEAEVKHFIEALLILVQRQAENKPLLRLTYGVLDKVHHLLSLTTFLSVISQLWKHDDVLVQKRAVAMFNDRVGHLSAGVVTKYQGMLMDTLPDVLWIFEAAPKKNDPELLQLGLMAMQQLAVHYAGQPAYMSQFMACLPVVLSHIVPVAAAAAPAAGKKTQQGKAGRRSATSAPSVPAAVTASAFVCLSHMIAQLKQRTVKHLNEWMPALLAFMSTQDSHVLNRLSALACLEQTIRHLHAFLSPYLGRIYNIVLGARAQVASVAAANPQIDLLNTKLDDILAQIAGHMQPRHLLPSLIEKTASLQGDDAQVPHLIAFVSHVISALSKEGIKQFHADVFDKVILVLLDMRPSYSPLAMHPLVSLVMKLNEDLFRPLFARMLQWSRVADSSSRRAPAFSHAVSTLFDSLKNLLVGYAAMAFEDLVEAVHAAVLDPVDANKVLAAQHALAVLNKTALYDSAGVVVGQLDMLAKAAVVALRVPALTPAATQALVQLAVTTNDDNAWKVVHAPLLAAMRANAMDEDDPLLRGLAEAAATASVAVPALDEDAELYWRSAAVAVVGQLFETVGEGYLVLLPETVPAIAECLEEEDLERVTAATVRQMEEVLGEPMAKYLQK